MHRILRPGCRALALLVSLLVANSAAAQEYDPPRKFMRGLANLTLGVLEIPRNIVEEHRANGVLSASTVGLALGIAKTPARTLLGAYEIITAPFELPADFTPMISPEFGWQLAAATPGADIAAADTFLSAEAEAIGRIPGAVVSRRGGALAVRFPSALLFEPGSWQLSGDARSRLAQLAGVLDEHGDARVNVLGYTDAKGTEAYNLTVSAARAASVRRALIERGVDRERIDSSGYGEVRPIASNDTSEGRRLNRRVEFEIRAGAVAAR